jgi:hypothetical protein
LTLLKLASHKQILGYGLDNVPDIIAMFDRIHASPFPALIDLPEQTFQLTAAIGGADTNLDSILV